MTGRLFGLRYDAVPDAPVWHEDVTAYDVFSVTPATGARTTRGRPARPDLPRPAPARGQVQARRAVHARQRRGRPAAARGRAGLQLRARADGARPRGDAVPRVRAPGAPRARRPRRVDPVRRRRDRVGLRRGAEPDARGVGLGRRDPAELRDRTPRASRSRPTWSTRMRAADDFGKGYQARQQMFYAAMSYWFHTERPADLTAEDGRAAGAVLAVPLPRRHPHVRQLRPPRRLLLGVLHLHVVAGDRQGPVLRVRPRTTSSTPRSPAATATGSSPPAAPGTPPTWSPTSSAGRTRSTRTPPGWRADGPAPVRPGISRPGRLRISTHRRTVPIYREPTPTVTRTRAGADRDTRTQTGRGVPIMGHHQGFNRQHSRHGEEQWGQHGGAARRGRGGPWGDWGSFGGPGHQGPPPWVAGLFGLSRGEQRRGPRVRRGDVRAAILDVVRTAEENDEPVNGYQVIGRSPSAAAAPGGRARARSTRPSSSSRTRAWSRPTTSAAAAPCR